MATVYAIWYAYARNRKQDKKINDLAAIAQELKDQNNITKLQLRDMAAPKFIVKEGSLSGDRLWVTLFNEGNKAKVGRRIVKSDEVSFEYSSGGIVLKNEELVFYGKAVGKKPLEDSNYYLVFEYFDIYGNSYGMGITGHGAVISSWAHFEGSMDKYLQSN